MGLDTSKDINPNAAKGYILEKFTKHKGGVNCMILNRSKNLLATGGEDKNVLLWRLDKKPTHCTAVLKGHTDYVTALDFHPKFLVSGSADFTVRKWCLSTHECLFVFDGHTERVNRVLCAGDFLFTTSVDTTLRAWTLLTHQYAAADDVCIRVFKGHSKAVYPIVFIPDENSSSDDKNISDKDVVITGSSDKSARIWSFKTGKPLHVLKYHKGTINALVVDPEAKYLFTGGGDGLICCWDIASGECTRQMKGHEGAVLHLLGHNKMLYSCSIDQTARAWIMDYGECIKVYRGHTHSVTHLFYKGGYVYTACADANSRMFRAKTGECKRVFKGHALAVVQLAVASNRLYTVSVDGTLRVWDTTGILDDDPPDDESIEVVTD